MILSVVSQRVTISKEISEDSEQRKDRNYKIYIIIFRHVNTFPSYDPGSFFIIIPEPHGETRSVPFFVYLLPVRENHSLVNYFTNGRFFFVFCVVHS